MNNQPPKQPKIGYRSSGDDMIEFLQSGLKMSAYRMDKKTAPGWYAALEELSAKAEVNTPALYHVPTHRINGGMALDALVLTDGLIKMGGSSHLDAKPSKEIMMVMAHELGHHKQSKALMIGARFLPWMLPMAGVAALCIYDRMQVDKKELQDLQESIDRTTGASIDDMKKAHEIGTFEDEHAKQVTEKWKENLLHAGRYVLVAALGAGLGLAASRSAMRHFEFDADRMATVLTGDPEGYISFLKKMHTVGRKEFTQELSAKARPLEVTEKIKDYIATAWKDLMANTIHAHPSMEERAAAIRKIPVSDYRELVHDSKIILPPGLGS